MWGRRTVVLGAEYDDRVRDALTSALRNLGARRVSHKWGFAGSQEIEIWKYRVGLRVLIIEAETYQGLTVSGPRGLVTRLLLLIGNAH